MVAIIYLILAWLTGVTLIHRLTGPFAFLRLPEKALEEAATLAAGLWVGLLPVTILTYALAYLSSRLTFITAYPLFVANLVMFTIMAIFLLTTHWPQLRHRHRRSSPDLHFHSLSTFLRSWRNRHDGALLMLGVTFFWVIFGVMLMWGTFIIQGGQLATSYAVFSDFAPHLALVRSFAIGSNWPTGYPHFAGDGIRYHFLFFFLCGNLNFLGLPIDWSINLPSLLGLCSLTVLLGVLARALTGHLAAVVLAPVLFLFRSSLALPIYLAERWKALAVATPQASIFVRMKILAAQLWGNSQFIGNTTHDDWGLWGLKVYANQRHFLSGMAVLVTLLLLVLPDLAPRAQPGKQEPEPKRYSRQVLAGILLVCLPYWHGSILVTALLCLGVWFVFLQQRLSWFAVAALGVISALLQSWFFSNGSSSLQPQLLWGFIAADHSLTGVLSYLVQVTGLALPIALVLLFRRNREQRLFLLAAGALVLFTFSVSLTVDVTVNHKYLMLAMLLINIMIAGWLLDLWHSRVPSRRLLVVILIVALTSTGLYEARILDNLNRSQISIPLESPLVSWIVNNTAPNAVFLTAPYHFNSFFLSGRKIFYGHAYYAWSAGHETAQRDQQVRTFLQASAQSPDQAKQFAIANSIDYLLIDDDLRSSQDFKVNEPFFAENFEKIAAFPDQGNTVIYDLRKRSEN